MMTRLDELKKDYKKILIILALFLIVHAVKMIVYLPTYDSVYGFSLNWTDGVDQGRWLRSILNNLLSSQYDLQWVEGLLGSIFLSLTVYYILRIFKITDDFVSYITALLFASFPSIAAIYTYGFWLPSFTLGLLMAVVAVYLIRSGKGNKKEYIVAIILFVLSLSIYQIYFAFAVGIILLRLVFDILDDKINIEWKKYANILIVIVISAGTYWMLNKIVMHIARVEFDPYQGFSSIGFLKPSEYIEAFYKMAVSFIVFFIPITEVTLYGIINVCLFCSLFILTINIVIKKNIELKYKVLSLCTMTLVIPITYCYYFFSADVTYHGIMELGNFLIYLLVILMSLEAINQNQRINILGGVKLGKISLGVIAILCFYNFVNTNVAYKQMELSYSRTEFAVQEIINEIDTLDTDGINEVAIIGSFQRNDNTITAVPRVNAAYTSIFLTHPYHFFQYANYYAGRNFVECDAKRVEKIMASAELELMNPYPSKNCIAIIEDTIVILLSESSE